MRLHFCSYLSHTRMKPFPPRAANPMYHYIINSCYHYHRFAFSDLPRVCAGEVGKLLQHCVACCNIQMINLYVHMYRYRIQDYIHIGFGGSEGSKISQDSQITSLQYRTVILR